MFIFVLILCLKKTSVLSLDIAKLIIIFQIIKYLPHFFYVFNSIIFLLAYLCVFFLFLLNLVYFMILNKRKVGAS